MTIARSPLSLQPACPHRLDADCAHCAARAASICASLAPDELAELEAIAHPVTFEAGETLFLESERKQAVFNVTSGVVRLYRLFRDGRRQVIGFSFPGDFVNVQMALDHGFSADAVNEVSACRFARADFASLLARKPALMQALHGRAAHVMRLMQDQVIALGRRNAEERVAWFLTQLRERSACTGSAIRVPMTRQDIADYLGLTIETVSRTLTSLARHGTIRIESGSIQILNEERVGDLAAV